MKSRWTEGNQKNPMSIDTMVSSTSDATLQRTQRSLQKWDVWLRISGFLSE
jgi:hypothetical protein